MNAKIKKFFLTLITAIVVACCTLLAACGEPDAVDQSSIKYDGKTITWNAVDDADGYTIQIDGGKEYSSSTNKFSYAVKSDVEQVEITITAKAGDKAGEAASKIFTRLPKIEKEDITFDENGKMSWTEVDGANEYILKINGEEVRTPSLEYEDFEKGKVNTIQIKPVAIDDSSFSDWSVELKKEYLAAPTDITYDGQYLRWTGIERASGYAIYINGSLYDEVSGKLTDYDAQNNNFDVTVKTLGDKVNSFDSEESESSSFIFLADIEGFNVVDGILTWDAVEEAQGYDVRINGNAIKRVETNKYEEIQAGEIVRIEVKPVTAEGTAYFANWSPEQKVHLLEAPKLIWNGDLNLDGQFANVITWNIIDGNVNGYNLKVVAPNGEETVHQLNADITQFGEAEREGFLETGEYKVSIQTIPEEGTGTYKSAYSKPIIVNRLPAPNQPVRNFVTSDSTSVKAGFTLSWTAVTAASGYRIYKDDAALPGTYTNTVANIDYQYVLNEDETQAKELTFSVQSLGEIKNFGDETRINLNSLTTKNLTAEITVLAQPANVQFKEYAVTWETVNGAQGYAVNCNNLDSTDVASYDLKNLGVGTVENFGICAKGNGGNVLASNYTAGVRLVRLEAPRNIKLAPASDGDILEWDSAANTKALRYDVFWSGSETAFANSNADINMRDYITESSKTLFMRAIANYMEGNTYYVTSLPSQIATFTKLSAPTFNTEKVDDNNWLVWNAPANVSGVDIRYRIYKKDVAQNQIVDTTSFDISDPVKYPSGDYEFYVQAYSESGNYVSSELSAKAAFTKLATPDVVREGAEYKWEAVRGAVGYVVQIGTEFYDLPSTQLSYAPNFNTPNKTYEVEIYAKGDKIDTIKSASWATTQQTKRARTPEFELSYCDDEGEEATQHVTGGKIQVTITWESNYTYGYEVKIGGVSRQLGAEDGLTLAYEVETADAYEVEVYANGGKFDENGLYYVKSETDDAQTITIYRAVSQLKKVEDRISWAFDGEAKYGYTVKITLTSGQVVEVTTKNMQVWYNDITEDVNGDPLETENGVEVATLTAEMIEEVEVVVNGGQTSTNVYIASKSTNI